MISYSRQIIEEDDIRSVIATLQSDWLTQGPEVTEFEKELAQFCGAKFAVAVCNGTAALHLACLTLDLGKEDMLWTSPNTFVASANCALYCGAKVDFVDIDPKTYNLSVTELRKRLINAATCNQLPKILIPVHFSGAACDMHGISLLAKEYGVKIIEDASHALGGTYRQKRIGSNEFADCTVMSFHPVKTITTGEGGAVTTNDERIYQKLLLLRTHGITREKALFSQNQEGDWYYEQQELGFNYRLSDIHAALGRSQLRKTDRFVGQRRNLHRRYHERLKNLPLQLPFDSPNGESAHHLYAVLLQEAAHVKKRKEIFQELRKGGIGVNVHYIPVHLRPYYRKLGFREGNFPVAEDYYQRALTLPLHGGMSIDNQDYIVNTLSKLLT